MPALTTPTPADVSTFTRVCDAWTSGDADTLAAIAFVLNAEKENLELRVTQLKARIHSMRGMRAAAQSSTCEGNPR